MSTNSNSTDVSDASSQSDTIGGFGYTIGIFFALLVVFSVITYASYRCKQVSGHTITTYHPRRGSIDTASTDDDSSIVTINHDGLDEVTISSYNKFTYSQLKPLKNESTPSGCSICLSDYKETDMLRMLPDCGHFFHLTCVDPWLRIHASCPICRSSPLPTPLAPAAQIHSQ